MKTYKPVEEKTNSELEICFNLNGYLDKMLKYKYDFIMREREGIVSDEGILMRKSMGPRGKRPQARGRGVAAVESVGWGLGRGDGAVEEDEETC